MDLNKSRCANQIAIRGTTGAGSLSDNIYPKKVYMYQIYTHTHIFKPVSITMLPVNDGVWIGL